MAVVDNASDAPSETAAPAREGVDPFRACDGAKANRLLGRPVVPALRAEAQRLVGAALVRVTAPGMAVTMDWRGNRLNIETDDRNRAIRFYCG